MDKKKDSSFPSFFSKRMSFSLLSISRKHKDSSLYQVFPSFGQKCLELQTATKIPGGIPMIKVQCPHRSLLTFSDLLQLLQPSFFHHAVMANTNKNSYQATHTSHSKLKKNLLKQTVYESTNNRSIQSTSKLIETTENYV